MRGRREKRRTRIIRLSCYVAAVVLLISAAMLDSATWIPFILCCLSIGWLTLVGVANDPYRKKGTREFADSTDANKK